jgi:hypothetical protein
MTPELKPPSAVREESQFPAPPRVRVVADDERLPEAVALAEALDECGAEAEVRLAGDATDYDHVHPDAIVAAGAPLDEATGHGIETQHPIRVAVADDPAQRRRARAAGYHLVVARPVDPSELMGRLEPYLCGSRA